MATPPKREPYWQRARQDTISAAKTIRFYAYEVGTCGLASAATVACLLRQGQDNLYVLTVVPIIAASFVGLPLGLLTLLSWHLFRAPYRQRDEAYGYLSSIETDGVAAAVASLRKEGHLERFCARADLFGAGTNVLDSSFGLQGLGRLAVIGVIDSEIVPGNPVPPLGGIPSMWDAPHALYKITRLGREVVRRACGGEDVE